MLALRFGGFRLDRRGGGLFRLHTAEPAEPIALGSRALDVLTVLVERRGELATKQNLMDAVWPGMAVEDSNLAVQIFALRRILDEGRTGGSAIQTVIGRGYRFLPPVEVESEPPPSLDSGATPPESAMRPKTDPGPPPDLPAAEVPVGPARSPRWHSLRLVLASAMVLSGVLLGALTVWRAAGIVQTASVAAPRLSLVVLPFQSLSGDRGEDYLADGITDDLTSDLSHVPQAIVIAGTSARTYKGRAVDARQIGQELGVRYILEGSVRRVGTTFRVNAQLIAGDTGAHVWSDRFDEPIADLANGQDAILARLRGALGLSLVEIEIARGLREPASTPDAFDLILRARALRNQPDNATREAAMMALFEQALRLDPSSVLALTGMVENLSAASALRGWSSFKQRQGAEAMLARATTLAPESEAVLRATAYWLHYEPEACQKAITAAQRVMERFPNNAPSYAILGFCKTALGHAEEEIALAEQAIRIDPLAPNLYYRYRRMGYAAMLLARDEQAIPWLEHALALNPGARKESLASTWQMLAAAYARSGKLDDAHNALDAAAKNWPFITARSNAPDNINPVHSAEIRRYQDALRLAGLRDHADEDADFGLPADIGLHAERAGYTPMTAPGAALIRTDELPRFIAERKPVIVDPLLNFWGSSLPGAIGLRDAGVGGSLTDDGQERLGRAMSELTGGDLARPIVAVGWNSERFDGRNLALRLVALGYTNVHWYRGGREAWEVANLPETDLVPRDW